MKHLKCDVNARNKEGRTACHWAGRGGHLKLLKWLVKVCLTSMSNSQITSVALLVVCVRAACSLLLMVWLWQQVGKADLSIRTKDGSSVFDWSVFGGSIPVVEYGYIQNHSQHFFRVQLRNVQSRETKYCIVCLQMA